MEFIGGVVADAKRRLDDPMILVAGDYNQWRMEEALVDFPDLREHGTGNTRGDRRIDRSFSNLTTVRVTGTLPPLESNHDPEERCPLRSDHKVTFFQADLPKIQTYEVLTYEYRYYNKESEAAYGRWLAGMSWREVLQADGSNEKTNLY